MAVMSSAVCSPQKKKQKRISFLIGTSVAVTGTKKKKNEKSRVHLNFPSKLALKNRL
jgi:hypothetical protein